MSQGRRSTDIVFLVSRLVEKKHIFYISSNQIKMKTIKIIHETNINLLAQMIYQPEIAIDVNL